VTSSDNNLDAERGQEEAIVPIRRATKSGGVSGTTTVSPLDLRAPATTKTGPRVPFLAVVSVLLGGLLFAVFFVLPRYVENPESESDIAAEVAASAALAEVPEVSGPVYTEEQLAEFRATAEDRLAELLELQRRLEERSAAVWGGEDWLTYMAESRAGDDAYLANDFVSANDRYSDALTLGINLIGRSDQIMSAALIAGDLAIDAGDAELALDQYRIVLSVNPDNARAIHGEARAGTLPDVLSLMQEGDQLRSAESLGGALAAYRQALALDPEWLPAERSRSEVAAAIASLRFDRLLSAGFAALSDKEFAEAETQFLVALQLRPSSEAAKDGQEQSRQGQKLDAIALAEIRAVAFERRELWDQAIERYTAALEADPTLAFANEGLARSQARADLDRKLVNLIDNPRLLLTDSILDDAKEILNEALAYAETGDRIGAQAGRLGMLVDAASNPIPVRLQSDGLTQVTVYRVGTFGTFSDLDIEVKPGTYTVVGSRAGYRDVRTMITVLPGRQPDPVSIVCVEPI
jgi:tetratricopeptide (TPR) repeat protein